MSEKLILDATCGGRSIWFQKNEPHTIFCDKREGEWGGDFCIGSDHPHHKSLSVSPDVICDFTELPFEDEYFRLVVFDPPHVENLKETSWFRKEYGSLDGDWKPMIRDGFKECMRVLKYGGGACVQMERSENQHTGNHQRDRARTAFRASKRQENEHALDVLYEV